MDIQKLGEQLARDVERAARARELAEPPSWLTAEIPSLKLPEMDGALASGFYRRLVEWINDYDANLDEMHEVGLRLVSFGKAATIQLTDVSYWNPSLIKFIGTDTETGHPVELIQHVGQISVLLTTLPRTDLDKPKARIGFKSEP